MSFLIIIFFLMVPFSVAEGAKEALFICLESVIPTLFPFIAAAKCAVLSKDIKEDNLLFRCISKLFNIPLCGAMAFIFGLVCGYPAGGKTAFDLYREKRISKKDAVRLACFTNNAGPAFVISVVGGGFLNSFSSGVIIYISHISASIICGLIIRGKEKYTYSSSLEQNSLPLSEVIPKAVCDSGIAMVNITAIIMFFSALSSAVFKLLPLSLSDTLIKQGLISGFFEITSGIRLISASDISYTAKMLIITFLTGFSGLSVIFQTGSFASGLNIKTAPCILCKVLSALISVLICYLIIFLR